MKTKNKLLVILLTIFLICSVSFKSFANSSIYYDLRDYENHVSGSQAWLLVEDNQGTIYLIIGAYKHIWIGVGSTNYFASYNDKTFSNQARHRIMYI